MKKSFAILGILFLLQCTKETITRQKELVVDPSSAIDCEGVYCAYRENNNSSEAKQTGDEVVLQLYSNNTYRYEEKQPDQSEVEKSYTGSYHFLEDGSTIVLDSLENTPNLFRLEEDQLVQLSDKSKREKILVLPKSS